MRESLQLAAAAGFVGVAVAVAVVVTGKEGTRGPRASATDNPTSLACLQARKAALLLELAEISAALQEPGPEQASTGPAKREKRSPPKAAKAADATKGNKSQAKRDPARAWTRAAKEARLQTVLPASAADKQALLQRQVIVRALPPGAMTEAELGAMFEALFAAVELSGTPAVERTQLYGGGTFAFLTLRCAALAHLALSLPPLHVGRVALTLARAHFETGANEEAVEAGAEVEAEVGALPGIPSTIPAGFQLPPVVLSMLEQAALGKHASLETKLYWSWRRHKGRPKPAEKEVREAFAFFKKTSRLLGQKKLIVDVCGSHGLLGALYAAYGKCEQAVILDKFKPGSFEELLLAWAPYLGARQARGDEETMGATGGAAGTDAAQGAMAVGAGATAATAGEGRVRFEVGDFKDTLPRLLRSYGPSEVAVVACHACSHLTDSIVDLCIGASVDFAVMPCCHRDHHTQGQVGLAARTLGVKEHEAIDVARLGGIAARGYDCRWRTIDPKITPENRLLIGLAKLSDSKLLHRTKILQHSDTKMSRVYARVHNFEEDPYAKASVATEDSSVATSQPRPPQAPPDVQKLGKPRRSLPGREVRRRSIMQMGKPRR